MEDCCEDCGACSGELCMKHVGPCECDVVDRHEDVHGALFYGAPEGMRRYPDPDEQDERTR